MSDYEWDIYSAKGPPPSVEEFISEDFKDLHESALLRIKALSERHCKELVELITWNVQEKPTRQGENDG